MIDLYVYHLKNTLQKIVANNTVICVHNMRQLQMFQKVEYGGGPIFKIVLES